MFSRCESVEMLWMEIPEHLHLKELTLVWKQNVTDTKWNELKCTERGVLERKDEVMLGHVRSFAAPKQKFKATNPEVTPHIPEDRT